MIARLRSLTGPEVRHEALLAVILLMESCVAASWFLLLNRPGAMHGAGAALLGVAGLVALAYVVTRLLLASSLSIGRQRILVLCLLLLTIVLFTRLHAYARFALGNTAWLAAWVNDWRTILSGLTAGPVTLVVVLFCWWRGVLLAYRETTLASVAFGFRLSVVLMAVVGLLWPADAGAGRLGLVFLFFLFAVLTLALARVDELGGRLGGPDQPFGPVWGAIVAGSALLVVGAGWVLARIYSPAGFSRLIEWLWPALQIVGSALKAVGRVILRVLMPILEALFAFLIGLLRSLGLGSQEVPITEFPNVTPTPMPAPIESAGGFPWLEVLRWSAILIFVGLGIAAVVFSLRRLNARRRPGLADGQRSVLSGAWMEDLLDNLRAGAAQVADALGLLDRFGLGKRLYAAVSIRFIYANLVRLAAARGFPRPPALTPYEFLPTLRRAFAGAEPDVERITEAYVAVHYGEAPASRHELQEIRRCWERAQAASPAPASSVESESAEQEGRQFDIPGN